MIRNLNRYLYQIGMEIFVFTFILGFTPHAKTVGTIIPEDSFFYLKFHNLAAC